jgi:hypothetical protein
MMARPRSAARPRVVRRRLVGSDTLGLAGVIHFDNKNAGSGKTLMFGDVALTDNPFGNYTLAGVSGTGTINPARWPSAASRSTPAPMTASLTATLAARRAPPRWAATWSRSAWWAAARPALPTKTSAAASGHGQRVQLQPGRRRWRQLCGAGADRPDRRHHAGLLSVSGMTAANRVYNLDYDSAAHRPQGHGQRRHAWACSAATM